MIRDNGDLIFLVVTSVTFSDTFKNTDTYTEASRLMDWKIFKLLHQHYSR